MREREREREKVSEQACKRERVKEEERWKKNDRYNVKVSLPLKINGGYPRDAEVTLFTLANPESVLRFNTHWSAPPVSALACSDLGR